MMHRGTPIISEVLRQGGRRCGLGPVLVSFEHGNVDPDAFEKFVPDLGVEFVPSAAEGSVSYNTVPKIDLTIKTNRLCYSNNVSSVKGRRLNPYQKTFLAVRNKRTNRIKLVEMSMVCVGAKVTPPPTTNSILVKEEMLKNELSVNGEPDPSEVRSKQLEMRMHAVGQFGRAKGKRAYEQRDRMHVAAEKLTDKLNKAAMGVSEEAIAMPSTISSSATFDLCPPRNANAVNLQDVYRVEEDILTFNDLESLQQAVAELLETYDAPDKIDDGVEAKIFTPIFGSMLQKALCFGRTKGCAAGLYMEGIIQFVSLRSAGFQKGPRSLPAFIPMTIRQKIFREFTSDQGTASPETKDKAVCYAIVLGLLTHDYSFDFSDLSSSIRSVKAEQMKKLVKVTGARLQTEPHTKKNMIVLKLPLTTFDATANSFRRKGGGGSR